jgi:hypothetical protein
MTVLLPLLVYEYIKPPTLRLTSAFDGVCLLERNANTF